MSTCMYMAQNVSSIKTVIHQMDFFVIAVFLFNYFYHVFQ